MKPAPFRYVRPATVESALELLRDNDGSVCTLAGGQTLVPLLRRRLVRPQVVVDIGRIVELARVEINSEGLELGPTTRLVTLTSEPLATAAPLLAKAAQRVGHAAIRHRATIGGSLASGEPAGEVPAALAALRATVTVASAAGARTLLAAQFLGRRAREVLGVQELIVRINVPRAGAAAQGLCEVTRAGHGYATAGAVFHAWRSGATVHRATIATFGRCAPGAIYPSAGQLLDSRLLEPSALNDAVRDVARTLEQWTEGTETTRAIVREMVRRCLYEAAR